MKKIEKRNEKFEKLKKIRKNWKNKDKLWKKLKNWKKKIKYWKKLINKMKKKLKIWKELKNIWNIKKIEFEFLNATVAWIIWIFAPKSWFCVINCQIMSKNLKMENW